MPEDEPWVTSEEIDRLTEQVAQGTTDRVQEEWGHAIDLAFICYGPIPELLEILQRLLRNEQVRTTGALAHVVHTLLGNWSELPALARAELIRELQQVLEVTDDWFIFFMVHDHFERPEYQSDGLELFGQLAKGAHERRRALAVFGLTKIERMAYDETIRRDCKLLLEEMKRVDPAILDLARRTAQDVLGDEKSP